MTDEEKRISLIKSYEGQIVRCLRHIERDKRRIASNRLVKKDPAGNIIHEQWLISKWQERIDRVKSGEPLENFVGTRFSREGEPQVYRKPPKGDPHKKKKKKKRQLQYKESPENFEDVRNWE